MKRIQPKQSKSQHKELLSLFLLPIILTFIGLFFIFEASSVSSFRNFGDSFYYLKAQTIWFGLGIGLMLFFSIFDYKKLYYLSLPALLVSIILLIAVLLPGIGSKVYGARRWIDLGFMSLQPTEFIKFSLILYLSSWLMSKEKKLFLSYFGLLGFIIVLTMLQPDLGTSIVIFGIFTILYFISGKDLKPFWLFIPVSGFGFFFLVTGSAYRMKRFLAFLNPDLDPLGITYHVKQILISLSSGGLLGRGFNESRQKYQFLPEAHTDSIFAIIGEEIGFIGGAIIIGLFFYLLYRTYSIAKNSHDKFAQLLSSAIFAIFALHIVINLGGMVNIMPLTGVPLPFLSYGGSSLIVFFSMIGILINIRKQNLN